MFHRQRQQRDRTGDLRRAMGERSTSTPEPVSNDSRSPKQATSTRPHVGSPRAEYNASLPDAIVQACNADAEQLDEARTKATVPPGPDDRSARGTRLAVLPSLRPAARRPAIRRRRPARTRSRPAGLRDRHGPADGQGRTEPRGSSGTARRRSPRFPTHWPDAYRKLVERRIKIIETNKEIGLIEKPEYKRRWNDEPWERAGTACLEELAARPAGRPPLLARHEDTSRPAIHGPAGRPGQRRPRVPAGRGLTGAAPTSTWPLSSPNWSRASRSRSCRSCGTSPRACGSGRSGNAPGTSSASRTPGRTWATSRCRPSTPRRTS